MDKKDILDLIRIGKVREAIDMLYDTVSTESEIKNEILSLSARYNFFESKIRNGILDDDSVSKNHSKIVFDLLKIIDSTNLDHENTGNKSAFINKNLKKSLLEIQSGYPNLSSFLHNSIGFSVWGTVISTTISKYTSDMIDLLEREGYIRLLISTPTKEVLEFQKFRSSMITDKEYMLNITMNSIKSALLLENQSEKGTLEIKSIPYLPNFGIIKVDYEKNKSLVLARLSGFKSSSGKQPVLIVDDDYWQEYFSEQFEKLWDKGIIISKDNVEELNQEWRKFLIE